MALDILETLSYKAKSDLPLLARVQEFDKAVKGLELFMKGLRTFLAESDMLDSESSMGSIPSKAKDMEEEATCQSDGLKMMMKRVKALLRGHWQDRCEVPLGCCNRT